MPVSGDYLQYVLEQLSALGELRAQHMFGGAGLYCAEVFFAIVSDDTVYLRADDASRADFTRRGMAAFRPYPDRPQVSMTYYEVPAEVLEDPEALVSWSRRAVAAAAAGKRPVRAQGTRRQGSGTGSRQPALRRRARRATPQADG